MFVIKRNGEKEHVKFDKITSRIEKLLFDIEDIDAVLITQKICNEIYSGITTTELDDFASRVCMSKVTENPNFGVLGARLAISNHQKNTKECFLQVVRDLRNNISPADITDSDSEDEVSSLVSRELEDIAVKYTKEINDIIKHDRDYLLDYFAFKTLEKSYLLKINKKVVERPQYLFMRVAIGIHGDDLENIKKTYDNISLKNYTHATPTLFNAGTNYPQLSSCYLTATEDSVEGIYGTIMDCAKISKWAGGIGVHISSIRADGSYIRKTGGHGNGIMPMLKVYNDTARYINQGGKRNGSFAMYLEPWHADIFTFLEAKRPHGEDNVSAKDLFYALWIPDLFMEKVFNDEDWYLMCPDKCKGLNDVYGEDFDKLYNKYVDKKRYTKQIKAREIWDAIIASQVETGIPYMLYKDACNKKSNQKNLGTIKSSNLCVSGDTMILTSEGYFAIKDLQDKKVEVWNGKEWSKTEVKKTGINQKLINIEFSNGMEIKCTEYHKFYIETGIRPADKSRPIIVEAKELKKNMKIIRYETSILKDNQNNINFPYTQGLFSADGTYSVSNKEEIRCSYKKIENTLFCKRHQTSEIKYNSKDTICCANSYSTRPMLSLYGKKKDLIEYIKYDFKGNYIEKEDKITLMLPYELKDKFYVPINNSLESKIKWLEGFADGDGCVLKLNGIKNIQITSININFMRDILYMLQTLGINIQIKIGKKKGNSLLPNGKGGKKLYSTEIVYRSSIDSSGLIKLVELGFSPKRLNITNLRKPHNKTNMYIKIQNIIDNNEVGDVFCFNEPKEHKGIFNGIIMGQCAEIVEYSSSEETAVCNLASICLQNMLETPNLGDVLSNVRWFKLLNKEERNMYKLFFETDLKIFSTEDCTYCKLLKALLKKTGLTWTEIDKEQAERYRLMANPTESVLKPFETVPQLFSVNRSEINHLGGYDDCWKFLSPKINHKKIVNIAHDLVINLNKIIDRNFYPIEKTKASNMCHRPIGIGVQGLADMFIKLRLPFDSPEAMKLNKEVFESIYYGAMESSWILAVKDGRYSSFEGSPLSEGKFQFNLWGLKDEDLSGRYDWNTLREYVKTNGTRNSLLVALMPTATTSQIMSSNECFEPFTSNVYTRRTLAGEFTIVNKYLIEDLLDLNIWNKETKERLLYYKGSVKNIEGLPKFLKDVYRTVWEIPQKSLIQMSADRAPFVCQSQSLNLYFDQLTYGKLQNAHRYGWKCGLKTGSYYIHSKPAKSPQRFGFDPEKEKELKKEDEICEGCSA